MEDLENPPDGRLLYEYQSPTLQCGLDLDSDDLLPAYICRPMTVDMFEILWITCCCPSFIFNVVDTIRSSASVYVLACG